MIYGKKFLVLSFIISLFIMGGCGEDVVAPETQSSGILTDYEGCKSFATTTALEKNFYSSAVECIEYAYDGEGILTLRHINAGFNCCPGRIDATITVSKNMIVIEDREEEQGCFCQCLFDLRYAILELEPGEYTISIKGPYIEETDERLLFNVQLYGSSSGTFCVDRTHYPWGVDR